jgi:hypothetical protein
VFASIAETELTLWRGGIYWCWLACRHYLVGVESGFPPPDVIARAGLGGEMSEVPAE